MTDALEYDQRLIIADLKQQKKDLKLQVVSLEKDLKEEQECVRLAEGVFDRDIVALTKQNRLLGGKIESKNPKLQCRIDALEKQNALLVQGIAGVTLSQQIIKKDYETQQIDLSYIYRKYHHLLMNTYGEYKDLDFAEFTTSAGAGKDGTGFGDCIAPEEDTKKGTEND